MTKPKLREAVRNLAKEKSTEVGALFPGDNVLLDYFIETAADIVMCDLARETPERIVLYEDLALTINVPTTAIVKEWIQIWTLNKTVTGKSNVPLRYVPWADEGLAKYQGETAEEPDSWSIYQNSIYWLPTPAKTTAAYARVWIVPSESSMPEAGPTYVPRIAQHLIPYEAMIQISAMLETDSTKWAAMYQSMLQRISFTLGMPVQGQPRFIPGAFADKIGIDSRDPALIDRIGFFER